MQDKKTGFTLIELLLAMAIAAVVVGTVYVTFFQSSKITQRLMLETEVYQMARMCMDRMIRDMNCIYISPYLVYDDEIRNNKTAVEKLIPKYRLFGKNVVDGTTEIDEIYFTTTSEIGFGEFSGLITEVDYFLKEDPDNKGLYLLVRREDYTPHDGISNRGIQMEIAEDVVSMSIKYYDRNNNETDEWDATRTDPPEIPYQIKVSMTFKSGDEEFTFTGVAAPVMAKMQLPKSQGTGGT